jgi:hypothetical protein
MATLKFWWLVGDWRIYIATCALAVLTVSVLDAANASIDVSDLTAPWGIIIGIVVATLIGIRISTIIALRDYEAQLETAHARLTDLLAPMK